MNGEHHLLQHILDHPDDDHPRLVYADWLRDHGENDRADLIQIQCELARLPPPRLVLHLHLREVRHTVQGHSSLDPTCAALGWIDEVGWKEARAAGICPGSLITVVAESSWHSGLVPAPRYTYYGELKSWVASSTIGNHSLVEIRFHGHPLSQEEIDNDNRREILKKREAQLLYPLSTRQPGGRSLRRPWVPDPVLLAADWWGESDPGNPIHLVDPCEFRRGFIHRVASTTELWLRHGPAVVEWVPTLAHVNFCDITVAFLHDTAVFDGVVPREFAGYMQDALDVGCNDPKEVLSRAAILWAKKQRVPMANTPTIG